MSTHRIAWILAAALCVTALIYWPGLSGGYIFDDYPNIVDNKAVQPDNITLASLTTAALSSPSSLFKRPLASLSFTGNYLLTGLDPYWMKATNLAIHLINGILVYLLSKLLISRLAPHHTLDSGILAVIIAASWLVLPINLTAVLYVVQRMESLAHLFTFAGLLGYCHGRLRMLNGQGGFASAIASVLIATSLGVLAKETAVLLPLYAAITEALIFRFQRPGDLIDKRIAGFFVAVLAIPLAFGLSWQLSIVLQPGAWVTRDFTLGERLLSESRVILSYMKWTLLPLPGDLSFYHDDFVVSRSITTPWTTAASVAALAFVIATAFGVRKQLPLVSLGLALYFGAHTLTGTILPLELVYEHRNYFASLGLLLAFIPWLASTQLVGPGFRTTLLVLFLSMWGGFTAWSTQAWAHPITLAQELAARAPYSPRAQYALARTYLNAANYDPDSPYLSEALSILNRTRTLPDASALPESALIFVHSKLNRPLEDAWRNDMIAKLASQRPDVQDEAAIMALTQCARDGECSIPIEFMVEMFITATSHSNTGARILAAYGDYAWNVLNDKTLALSLARDATLRAPDEPTYLITLLRMQRATGHTDEAQETQARLEAMNTFGRLNGEIEFPISDATSATKR